MILLGATLPNYDNPKKKTYKGQEVIDATDPKNKQRVRDFFNSIE